MECFNIIVLVAIYLLFQGFLLLIYSVPKKIKKEARIGLLKVNILLNVVYSAFFILEYRGIVWEKLLVLGLAAAIFAVFENCFWYALGKYIKNKRQSE